MNFFHDLAQILRNELTVSGYTVAPTDSDEMVVKGYLNVLHRSIPKGSRKTFESQEFNCPANLAAGYAEIKRKVQAGESLRPHQSRKLDEPEYDDALLNDWGVHHLHLGTTLSNQGYVARTGPLLFARVTSDAFYAIQIYSHGAWSKREIVEILHRNWPDSIERFALKGINLQFDLTEHDIGDFRRVGIQPLVQIDKTVYAPLGGGLMLSGDSMRVVQGVGDLRKVCKGLEQLTSQFAEREAANGKPLPSESFALVRKSDQAVVIETSVSLGLFAVQWPINNNLC